MSASAVSNPAASSSSPGGLSPSGFESLPREILRCITAQSSSSTALSLMLTSRRLFQNVEPLLYEHINWSVDRIYDRPPIYQLLERLSRRPEVGRWVRSFTMTGRYDCHTYAEMSSETIQTCVAKAITAFPYLNLKTWRHLIRSSSTVVLLSILLLFFPNLTSLVLWSGYNPIASRQSLLSEAIATLPNLKSIEYGIGFTKFPCIPWRDKSITFLFALPTIRTLRIQVSEDVEPDSDSIPLEAFPIAVHITSLYLYSSVLSAPAVSRLLSRLPYLRVLEMGLLRETAPSRAYAYKIDSFIECDELGEALLQLAPTLEKLTIATEFYLTPEGHRYDGGPYLAGRQGNPGTRFYWGTKGTLSSLHRFPKLTYLEVDPILLLGWDISNMEELSHVLPKSLKHLRLRIDFTDCLAWKGRVPWMQDLINVFLESDNGGTLEYLDVKFLESHGMKYFDQVAEMLNNCTAKGVEMGMEFFVG